MIDDDIHLENERIATLKYINDNPFPKKEDIITYLASLGIRNVFLVGNEIYDISENLYTHVIYQLPDFKDAVRTIGQRIYEEYGHFMMVLVYYAVCMPFKKSTNPSMRQAGRIIEQYWHGIGEWQR